MLHCLIMPSSSSTTTRRRKSPNPSVVPSLQGSSAEDTPSSSTQPPSPPHINLTREYTLAIHTTSYSEIWSRTHPKDPFYEQVCLGGGGGGGGGEDLEEHHQSLEQVLNPNRECVDKALEHAKPTILTRLVSTYFDHSENTFHLCLLLHRSVCRARSTYHHLHNLLDAFPLDSDPTSLSQSQCDLAFDIFLRLDLLDNPFPHPDSHNFNNMRHCFSQLNEQLHRRLCKSRSSVRLMRRATTVCLIGPLLPAAVLLLPSKITRKKMAHIAQLDAAAKGTYVLHNDLDTIDRLVERLYTAIEGDKFLVRLGLERSKDRYPIHEIAKQLQKSRFNFHSQLMDLEEHICLCFAGINRARSLLLDEIHPQESPDSF